MRVIKWEPFRDADDVFERFYGSFARRFALPENADEQGISAESRDGVIVIRIPKQRVVEPQPRQIQIQ